MDKAGIITNVSDYQVWIDKQEAEGKPVIVSKMADQLLKATRSALENGRKL